MLSVFTGLVAQTTVFYTSLLIVFLVCRTMWKFLEMTVSDLDRLNSYVKDNQEVTKQLLKEAPNITA